MVLEMFFHLTFQPLIETSQCFIAEVPVTCMEVERSASGNTTHMGADEETKSNQLEGKPMFGDVIWVRTNGCSWWPAQVVDRNTVALNKMKGKASAGEVLVRLVGSYTYIFADPVKCGSDFEKVLKRNNGSYTQIFSQSLKQEIILCKYGGIKKRASKSNGDIRLESTASRKKFVKREDMSNGPKQEEKVKIISMRGKARKELKGNGQKRKSKDEASRRSKLSSNPEGMILKSPAPGGEANGEVSKQKKRKSNGEASRKILKHSSHQEGLIQKGLAPGGNANSEASKQQKRKLKGEASGEASKQNKSKLNGEASRKISKHSSHKEGMIQKGPTPGGEANGEASKQKKRKLRRAEAGEGSKTSLKKGAEEKGRKEKHISVEASKKRKPKSDGEEGGSKTVSKKPKLSRRRIDKSSVKNQPGTLPKSKVEGELEEASGVSSCRRIRVMQSLGLVSPCASLFN